MDAARPHSVSSVRTRRVVLLAAGLAAVLTMLLAAGALAAPGGLILCSSSASGMQANGVINFSVISADGRYVAFSTAATNLVTPPTTGSQIFRKDLITGATVLVSSSAAGVQGNSMSMTCSISADGRFVSFTSDSTNLVTPATADVQVFRKDLSNGAIVLVSASATGVPGNAAEGFCSISADGSMVSFLSDAPNLVVPPTTNTQVFRKNLNTAAIQLVSATAAGAQGNANSVFSSISADGRFVVLSSAATNLLAAPTTNTQVFRKDTETGAIVLISSSAAGVQGNNNSLFPSVNADASFVGFTSISTNLLAAPTTGQQVFRKNIATGALDLVSASAAGVQGNSNSALSFLSSDGDYVAFISISTNLVTPATVTMNVFRKQISSGLVALVSSNAAGAEGDNPSTASMLDGMSADGRYVTFLSASANFVSPAPTFNQAFRKELPVAFYFAEGTCRPGFDAYITIQNPGAATANVTISYMKGDSTTLDQPVAVPAHSRSTVAVKSVLGEGNDAAHDFSAKVASTNGQTIIAERPMYFNYKPGQLNWTGGHDVVGALSPSTVFYFAEGTCRPGFDPYLTLQNPGGTDAAVTITYMKGDGTTVDQTLTVPAHTRSTVTVSQTLGVADDAAHDFSSRVVCTNGQMIVAERPMYFNYKPDQLNWNGGHNVVGAVFPAPNFFFAEGTCRPGFDPYLTIQNPGAVAAEVSIDFMLGNGATTTKTVSVPAHARSTVTVRETLGTGDDAAHDFSCQVACTNGQQIIAERPMYFSYKPGQLNWTGGSDVVGALSSAQTFFFAEGTCRPGFDPYITIQNPGAATANVTITYFKGDGTTITDTLTVAAHSRSTVTVRNKLGTGDDAAHDFSATVTCTNARQIIAERPMYFNYKPGTLNWNGGHDVVGLY